MLIESRADGIQLCLLLAVGSACVVGALLAVYGLIRLLRRASPKRQSMLTLVARLFLSGGGLVTGVYLVLLILESSDLYIYIGGMISQEWRKNIKFLIPLLLGIGLLLLLARRVRLWVTALLSLLLTVFLILLFGAMAFVATEYRYTEVTAPDEAHELVFLEKGYHLFGGDGDVYERTSRHILRKLGDYPADDYTFPVYNGTCTFDWRGDGVDLRDRYGDWKWSFDYIRKRS